MGYMDILVCSLLDYTWSVGDRHIIYILMTDQAFLADYRKSRDIAQKRPSICQKEGRFLALCLKIKKEDVLQCRQYVEMVIYCQKSQGSFM